MARSTPSTVVIKHHALPIGSADFISIPLETVMIQVVEGNLITAFQNDEINFMAHCCNMQNVMGAGIAKQIKKAFPEAYIADINWFHTKKDKREHSHLSLARIETDKYICNVYGQEHFGTFKKQLNEDFLRLGLMQLADLTDSGDTIGLPYGMGCGLAGGDWNVVYQIIEDVFIRLHNVKIYQLR